MLFNKFSFLIKFYLKKNALVGIKASLMNPFRIWKQLDSIKIMKLHFLNYYTGSVV